MFSPFTRFATPSSPCTSSSREPPRRRDPAWAAAAAAARGQGLTLVSISAQLELTLPLSAQLELYSLSPSDPNHPWMCP